MATFGWKFIQVITIWAPVLWSWSVVNWDRSALLMPGIRKFHQWWVMGDDFCFIGSLPQTLYTYICIHMQVHPNMPMISAKLLCWPFGVEGLDPVILHPWVAVLFPVESSTIPWLVDYHRVYTWFNWDCEPSDNMTTYSPTKNVIARDVVWSLVGRCPVSFHTTFSGDLHNPQLW